jgi:signal transduction histidine kinase
MGQLLILRDITDQKAAAVALKEANLKLNILNDITRHDIRNKLTGLLLYVETIRESSDPVEIKASVKKIGETARVLASQIEFTRTYQDLGVKSPLWQDLDATVEKVISQVDFRDISFKSDLHREEIYADPLFERVVYNLLENAVKSGGPKISSIRITAQEVPAGLSIVVDDDGVGIPEPDKEKIFSRGYGTNTGLGLFLSREILAITGITIRENGEQGKGARFEILVPKGKYRSGSP